jgi:hypothetical protein
MYSTQTNASQKKVFGAGFAELTFAYKISHDLKLEGVIDFRTYISSSPPSGKESLIYSGILWRYMGS